MSGVGRPKSFTMKKGVLFIFFLGILLAGIVDAAADRWDCKRLAIQGIDCRRLNILDYSGDGSVFLAVERVGDLQTRLKGFCWNLRIFRFNSQNHLVRMNPILIPIIHFENFAVSDDGQTMIVSGEYGSKLLKIDLTSGNVETVFSRIPGKAGFRPEGRIWYAGGAFFCKGYFLDQGGRLIKNAVVKLDLSQPNQPQFFQETWDLDDTYKHLGKPLTELLISAATGFFTGKSDSGKETLYYSDNGKISPLDSATAFGRVAAGGNRVFYTVFVDKNMFEGILRDLSSQKTWNLRENKPFGLPYISKDGSVAVLGLPGTKKGFFSYFYGKQDDGFILHPIPDLQEVPRLFFRLSADGKAFAGLGPQGLIFGTIP